MHKQNKTYLLRYLILNKTMFIVPEIIQQNSDFQMILAIKIYRNYNKKLKCYTNTAPMCKKFNYFLFHPSIFENHSEKICTSIINKKKITN